MAHGPLSVSEQNQTQEVEITPEMVERARAVLSGVVEWVGWEMWEAGAPKVSLDGKFSPDELEALAIVLRH
jgi:hypothetical protein